jgi:hypothetical protein
MNRKTTFCVTFCVPVQAPYVVVDDWIVSTQIAIVHYDNHGFVRNTN